MVDIDVPNIFCLKFSGCKTIIIMSKTLLLVGCHFVLLMSLIWQVDEFTLQCLSLISGVVETLAL